MTATLCQGEGGEDAKNAESGEDNGMEDKEEVDTLSEGEERKEDNDEEEYEETGDFQRVRPGRGKPVSYKDLNSSGKPSRTSMKDRFDGSALSGDGAGGRVDGRGPGGADGDGRSQKALALAEKRRLRALAGWSKRKEKIKQTKALLLARKRKVSGEGKGGKPPLKLSDQKRKRQRPHHAEQQRRLERQSQMGPEQGNGRGGGGEQREAGVGLRPKDGEAEDKGGAEAGGKSLQSLVRVATSEEDMASACLLDEEDVPCGLEGGVQVWESLQLPRLSMIPLGPVRIGENMYAYMSDSMWKLASAMFMKLGPEAAETLLGGLVRRMEEGEGEEGGGAWGGPTPADDPAMVIPDLGSVYGRRKRGSDRWEGEEEGGEGEEPREACGADLGEGGALRALWAFRRREALPSAHPPVLSPLSRDGRQRKSTGGEEAGGEGCGDGSGNKSTENGRGEEKAERESGAWGHGPRIFKNDSSLLVKQEAEHRPGLPCLRLRAVVEEGGEGGPTLSLRCVRTTLPIPTPEDGTMAAGRAPGEAEMQKVEEMRVEYEAVDILFPSLPPSGSPLASSLAPSRGKEKKSAGKGRGGQDKKEIEALGPEANLPFPPTEARLLRFWETGLLARGRQDRKHEIAEEAAHFFASAPPPLPPTPGASSKLPVPDVPGASLPPVPPSAEGGLAPFSSPPAPTAQSPPAATSAWTARYAIVPGADQEEIRTKKAAQHPEVGEDEILTQLVDLQEQLVRTMRRNLAPARVLYRKMVAAFEGGKSAFGRRRKERDVVARYETALEDRKRKEGGGDGREGEKEGAEETMTECAVCHRTEAGGRNSLVFCDGCNMAVHTFCYCVHSLPAGAWHCQVCEAGLECEVGGKAGEKEGGREGGKEGGKGDYVSPLLAPPSKRCMLCAAAGGAMRKAKNGSKKRRRPGADGKAMQADAQAPREGGEEEWAHVECCRWLGMIDGRTGEIPHLKPRLQALRRHHMREYTAAEKAASGDAGHGDGPFCSPSSLPTIDYKCHVQFCPCPHQGGLLRCSSPGCFSFFHATCGRRNGQEMYHGRRFGDRAWLAFCDLHTDPLRFVEIMTKVGVSYEPSAEEADDGSMAFERLWEVEREKEERQAARRAAHGEKKLPEGVGRRGEGYARFKQMLKEEDRREEEVDIRRRKEEEDVKRRQEEYNATVFAAATHQHQLQLQQQQQQQEVLRQQQQQQPPPPPLHPMPPMSIHGDFMSALPLPGGGGAPAHPPSMPVPPFPLPGMPMGSMAAALGGKPLNFPVPSFPPPPPPPLPSAHPGDPPPLASRYPANFGGGGGGDMVDFAPPRMPAVMREAAYDGKPMGKEGGEGHGGDGGMRLGSLWSALGENGGQAGQSEGSRLGNTASVAFPSVPPFPASAGAGGKAKKVKKKTREKRLQRVLDHFQIPYPASLLLGPAPSKEVAVQGMGEKGMGGQAGQEGGGSPKQQKSIKRRKREESLEGWVEAHLASFPVAARKALLEANPGLKQEEEEETRSTSFPPSLPPSLMMALPPSMGSEGLSVGGGHGEGGSGGDSFAYLAHFPPPAPLGLSSTRGGGSSSTLGLEGSAGAGKDDQEAGMKRKFPCEDCGSVLGTMANLQRHRKRACKGSSPLGAHGKRGSFDVSIDSRMSDSGPKGGDRDMVMTAITPLPVDSDGGGGGAQGKDEGLREGDDVMPGIEGSPSNPSVAPSGLEMREGDGMGGSGREEERATSGAPAASKSSYTDVMTI